ncbi:MAG: hypothetical protein AAFN93_21685 [Bacteroidota bacterium]
MVTLRGKRTPQSNFSKIPGSPIAYWVSERVVEIFEENISLGEIVSAKVGLQTGENRRFLRYWFEVSNERIFLYAKNREEAQQSGRYWFPYNKGGHYRKWYGNQEYIVNWADDGKEIRCFTDSQGKPRSVIRNPNYYFKESVSWSDVASGGLSFRFYPHGFIYDVKGQSSFPNNKLEKEKLLALLNSNFVAKLIPLINPTVSTQIGDFQKLPGIILDNSLIDSIVTDCILLSQFDWDQHEASWHFISHQLFNNQLNSLFESYQYYCKLNSENFFILHRNEEQINGIVNGNLYIINEINNSIPLSDITILQEELDRDKLAELEPLYRTKGPDAIELPIKRDVVMQQFISYAVGCMMGRYSLDHPSLILASQGETLADYYAKLAASDVAEGAEKFTPDEDGIVPIMGTEGDFPDDALRRTEAFLDAIWGPHTRTENMNFLQECLGMSLENYLVKHF